MNSQEETDSVPAVIVGGGPVGLATAIELGRRGIRCTVIERTRALHRVPKGQNLTQRTLEHFRTWGIEQELRRARTTGPDLPTAGLVAYGTALSEYHYRWMQRSRVGEYYAAANDRLPQYETERVLRECLQALPTVTMRSGWRAAAVQQHDDLVQLDLVSDSGERSALRAAWVIGCDGSRSVVREQAGITQTTTARERRMVLAVFRSAEFDALVANLPPASVINVLHPALDGYWQFFGRVDSSGAWFFHAPVDADATLETLNLGDVLARAAGRRYDFAVEHLGFWDLRFALADTYRSGRILIAGDAAHSHPPYGGYGINTGFEDAMNLGWKLAAVLDGWADHSLLDSYDTERRPVFASLRDEFIAKSISDDRAFLRRFNPDEDRAAFEAAWMRREQEAAGEIDRYEPNYEGSSIVAGSVGTPSAVGSHLRAARAGHHLAPGTDAAGEELFDRLSAGFTVLAAPDTDASAFETAAGELGVPLQTITLSDDSADAYGSDVILVRPDQFVAWTGRANADAAQVLQRSIRPLR